MFEHRHTNQHTSCEISSAFPALNRSLHHEFITRSASQVAARYGARTELIPCSTPTKRSLVVRGSVGSSGRSGVLRGNNRYVVFHATLFDITIFSHIAFHHRFLAGFPFVFALLLNIPQLLS